MKRGDVWTAAEYESLVSVTGRGAGYSSNRLYAIDGEPGIWRRVPPPDDAATRKDLVKARYGASTIYLVYDSAAVLELTQGGFSFTQALMSPEIHAVIQESLKGPQPSVILPRELDPSSIVTAGDPNLVVKVSESDPPLFQVSSPEPDLAAPVMELDPDVSLVPTENASL